MVRSESRAASSLLQLHKLPAAARRFHNTLCTAIFKADLPFTITSAGTYCLAESASLNLDSGAAITIDANSVVLDLNANKMGNLKNGVNTEAVGITSTERRKNITIQNGAVRGLRIVNFMPPRFVRSEISRLWMICEASVDACRGQQELMKRCNTG